MSVADLTNTTWVFNEQCFPDSSAGYYINFMSNNVSFDKLLLTYGKMPTSNYIHYSQGETQIEVWNYSGWTNTAYKTITITGGTDATNTTLIAWLESNATQTIEQSLSPNRLYIKCNGNGRPQVKVPAVEVEGDALAGTWVFNNTVNGSLSQINVNFINDTTEYTSIRCIISEHLGTVIYYGKNTSVYYDGWDMESSKTITITSKLSEVTNGDSLLAWLQSNATKQSAAATTTTTHGGRLYAKVEVAEDPLAGTWVFNDSLSYGSFSSFNYSYNINFTSNGTTYNELSSPDPGALPNIGIDLRYGSTTVYNTKSGWTNTAYKTIIITSKLSEVTNGDTLLAWLQANATKQGTSTPTLISFTIAGTTYQAEEGMTWTEWCDSNYNTSGFYTIEGNTGVVFPNGTDYVSLEGFSGAFADNTSQIVANGTYYRFSSGTGN